MSLADERAYHALMNPKPTPAPDGQLGFDDLLAEVDEKAARRHKLWNDLDEWIHTNPSLWKAMVDKARDMAARGHKFGANGLLYWARFEHFIRYTKGAQFALNNNFAPVVARRLIAEHPELEEFIETRYSVVDEADGLTPYSERRAG